jgi:hypothetical protein
VPLVPPGLLHTHMPSLPCGQHAHVFGSEGFAGKAVCCKLCQLQPEMPCTQPLQTGGTVAKPHCSLTALVHMSLLSGLGVCHQLLLNYHLCVFALLQVMASTVEQPVHECDQPTPTMQLAGRTASWDRQQTRPIHFPHLDWTATGCMHQWLRSH